MRCGWNVKYAGTTAYTGIRDDLKGQDRRRSHGCKEEKVAMYVNEGDKRLNFTVLQGQLSHGSKVI